MGLAPYGKPIYADAIYKHLMDLKADGSFWLNMDYFNYCQGLTMTNRKFADLFGAPPRNPETSIEQRHMDLAASIQAVTEEIVLRMARDLHQKTKMKHLVLAGGVALNCVANGRLLREGPYEDIWIQPAAGDAGSWARPSTVAPAPDIRPPTAGHPEGSFLGRCSSGMVGGFWNKGVPYTRINDDQALAESVAGCWPRGR
jgi:carbamoyltransferase